MTAFENAFKILLGIGVVVGVMAFAHSIEAKDCPTGKEFKTTGDWHGCKCPDGYQKKYLDALKYKAKCLPASGGHITCPTGHDFSTTAFSQWHDCKCPTGYTKKYTDQITKADAICMKTDASGRFLCPLDKHFSTTGEWRNCKCPDGYWKEYDDSIAFSKASCVYGDKPRSEDAQCKSKGGRWVGAKGHHARGFCIPCRDVDCAEAVANPLYHAYKIYFAAIGSGATMRNLPPAVQQKLNPYFSAGLLKVIQYGGSHHTASDSAMTDCTKIYFPAGSGVVAKIHNSKIVNVTEKEDFRWLIHEITHSKQCQDSSQVRYAERWFGELGITTIEQLAKNPMKVSSTLIHNKMPMEKDAKQNADAIIKKLFP